MQVGHVSAHFARLCRKVNLAEWIHYWVLRTDDRAPMPLVADINTRLQLLLQYDPKVGQGAHGDIHADVNHSELEMTRYNWIKIRYNRVYLDA